MLSSEALGGVVVMIDVLEDRLLSCATLLNVPRRKRFCVSSRNQRSTRFSHELLVGVKCMWNRG